MRRLGYFMVLLFLFSCKTVQVEVLDRQEGFDLEQYESFRFIENDGEAFSPDYRQKINFLKDEIVRQMNARGLALDNQSPDLLVNIGIAVEERQIGVTDPGSFNYIGQRRYQWDSELIQAGRYPQGSMAIHLVDRERGQAVWIGTVEKLLPREAGHLREAVIRGVERLFREMDR
jgi:hypothetical protein